MFRKFKAIVFVLYKNVFGIYGRILPKNDKIIVFESFLGKQYSDNPRAIYEYIKEHYPEYQLYWSVDRKNQHVFQERNIVFIRRFTFKWLLIMNRAKYWVSNSRLPLWIQKPEKTIYLQTWHGTPLKRLAADMDEVYMPGTNIAQYKRNFLSETKKWDYLVSPNAYSTERFKSAFQFNENIIESGYPRNDYLINNHNNETEQNRIKAILNIPKDKKIVLYAPTWRDNEYHGIGRYKFTIQMDLDKMRKELGEEYVVVLRMHYLISDQLEIEKYEEFVYDCSKYEDIRELYLISDVLVTDYSSVFFDYANLKRPMIFYVYDIESYRDSLRGFYFDFEKMAPGPLVKTTDELIAAIETSDTFVLKEEVAEFYRALSLLEDGNATKRVVETLLNK